MAHRSPRGSFQAPVVLSTKEAREALPALAENAHKTGMNAGIVFFGPHRKARAAIVPVALLQELSSLLEDLYLTPKVRQRLADDGGERISLAEALHALGVDPVELENEKDNLRRELGISS